MPQDIPLFLPRLRPSKLVTYLRWLVTREPGESVYDIQWPTVRPSQFALDCLDANEILLNNTQQ